MPRCLAGSVERHRRIAKVCDRPELPWAIKNLKVRLTLRRQPPHKKLKSKADSSEALLHELAIQ